MTTLELLNEIEKAPAFMGGNERYKSVAGSDILYKQDIECIRKELKVLEILKKLPFEICLNGGGDDWSWFIDLKQSFIISEEDAKTIKEWLKYDK